MLTANGKALSKFTNSYSRGSTTFMFTDGTTGARSTGGLTQIFTSMKLCVGTGSATPASTDYAITNADAGLTVVTRTGTNDGTAASYTQDYIGIFSVTYRNDTASDITVSEVGLIGSSNSADILLARETFTPVTIEPGDSYTFTMYIG